MIVEDRIIQWQWLLMPFQLMWDKLGWFSILFWVVAVLFGTYIYYKYVAGVRPGQ